MSQDLATLGWSPFFADQIAEDEDTLIPARIAGVSRSRATGLMAAEGAPQLLSFPPGLTSGDVAVGDWVLVEPATLRIARKLASRTTLTRRAAGHVAYAQKIAANVDTLFVVTSCNNDFNPARLERYLAVAMDAGCAPVIVLTKADETDEAARFLAEAQAISAEVPAVVLNARDPAQLTALRDWCATGRTVALIGSSGVGKSTLINGLTGSEQATQGMRQDDAKGRHTTTSRSLHRVAGGGWLIDMPGMREFGLHDVGGGIDLLFADVTALAGQCKFRDCAHEAEPGCAILAAAAGGTLDPDRLARWRKLKAEDAQNVASVAETRARGRATAGTIKSAKRAKKARRFEQGAD